MALARQESSETRYRSPPRKRDLLYDRCVATKAIGDVFTLRELEEFGVIEDAEELRQTCQELMDYHLFAMLNRSTYKTRSKEDAVKIAELPQESLMLYTQIESSHNNGIWRRTLVDKTRMHESVITKGIKELISKTLIKEIKLAKYPAKRVYMLSHLEPSSQDSGGNFFNDGEMDVGMVEVIGDIIVNEIQKYGWTEEEIQTITRKELKRKRTSGSTVDDSRLSEFRHSYSKGNNPRVLIPKSSTYEGYLSAGPLLEKVEEFGILKNSVSLGKGDIQQLLDQLEYDGQVQKMGSRLKEKPTYRSVRRTWEPIQDTSDQDPSEKVQSPTRNFLGPGNGLTHTPCGVCPVFKSCKPGGVVSPETCEYFDAWLEF